MDWQAIVVRPKWVWRLGFPVGAIGVAVAYAAGPDPWDAVIFLVPGLLATAAVWEHRVEVDELRMTVTHHRAPFPTRRVRIDRVDRLTCHWEDAGSPRVRLRIHDDRGGRIVIKVWLWSAWRELARAVAAHASPRLVLDKETARRLGRLDRQSEPAPGEWVPPDPDV